MLDMANSLRHDPEKPVFHVMPRHGWVCSQFIALRECTVAVQHCSFDLQPAEQHADSGAALVLQINDPNGPVYYGGKNHV